MNVLILAAGYGTRLYPLTLNIPKALIPINNKPMINFLIEKVAVLRKLFPIKEVKIVTNDKFYKSFLEWKKKYKIKAEVLNDGSKSLRDRLGAIGDIRFGIKDQSQDWLVLGADNLFEDNLEKFISFALAKKPYPSLGLYDVKCKKMARRFGVALLNKRKRVVKLKEKPKKPFSTLAASCVYFFPEQSLNLLDLFINENSVVDAAGEYIAWLSKKTKVFGYTLQGKWIDIGHLDSLKLAEYVFKPKPKNRDTYLFPCKKERFLKKVCVPIFSKRS